MVYSAVSGFPVHRHNVLPADPLSGCAGRLILFENTCDGRAAPRTMSGHITISAFPTNDHLEQVNMKISSGGNIGNMLPSALVTVIHSTAIKTTKQPLISPTSFSCHNFNHPPQNIHQRHDRSSCPCLHGCPSQSYGQQQRRRRCSRHIPERAR
jgi:hypothetical protein